MILEIKLRLYPDIRYWSESVHVDGVPRSELLCFCVDPAWSTFWLSETLPESFLLTVSTVKFDGATPVKISATGQWYVDRLYGAFTWAVSDLISDLGLRDTTLWVRMTAR